MKMVEVSFRQYEGYRYKQESPDPRDLDVLSDLYLGADALGGKPAPEYLRVTIHFDVATSQAGQDQREQTVAEIDVVVGFYRERGRTIRYKQEIPDPDVMEVIPSPYIGKQAIEQAVGAGQVPEKLRLTLHLD